jgi:hypothetical protein
VRLVKAFPAFFYRFPYVKHAFFGFLRPTKEKCYMEKEARILVFTEKRRKKE